MTTPQDMTLCVNNTEYQVNSKLREVIEHRITSEYGENNFLEYYWTIENTDPVVKIETEGNYVPWDKLSEFEVNNNNSSDDTNTSQNKNPVNNSPDNPNPRTIKSNASTLMKRQQDNKNSNDNTSQDTSTPSDDDIDDYKKVMFPESVRPFPDPDDEDFGTLPPMPEEFDEEENEETLIIPIPENQRIERWAAGEAIIPVYSTLTWNLQDRADSIPRYGTHNTSTQSIPQESEITRNNQQNSHDEWEALLEHCDCPIITESITQDEQDNTSDENTDTDDDVLDMYDTSSDSGPKYSDSKQNFTI